MKALKLFSAGLLAVALTGSSFAAVNLHVTGSTAFRKALYVALISQLGGATNCRVAYVGSAANTLLKSNQATFTNIATGDTVYCCMAGSVGGVNWVANQIPAATSLTASTAAAWVSLSNANSAPSADGTTGGTNYATPTFDAAQVADMTMSDSLQSSTPYNYTALSGKKLVDNAVGVVTFVFAKGTQDTAVGGISATQYAAVTNMSPLAFQNLASNGIVPLSMFSGNSADNTVADIVLTGRDDDSGTRLAAFAETGLGPVTSGNTQMQLFNSTGGDIGEGVAGPITSMQIWGVGFAGTGTPNSALGYSSGGKVKTCLLASQTGAKDLANLPFVLVSYVGLGDTPGAAQQLTYNGIAYSTTAVQEGTYTFWTKEHMMWRSDKVNVNSASNSAFLGSATTGLGLAISNNAAASLGVSLASMHVDRAFEGGSINHL